MFQDDLWERNDAATSYPGAEHLLKDIEAILGARSREAVWQHYVDRLCAMGFAHVSYHRSCMLQMDDDPRFDPWPDNSLFLSSLPSAFLGDVLSQGSLDCLPMYRWLLEHSEGSESWEWMRVQRRAGRLSQAQIRALDHFAAHGYTEGYAISLADPVLPVRAGVILGGPAGVARASLEASWRAHRPVIMALSGLINLQLSSLRAALGQNLLTARQREVLEHCSNGRTIQEIADLLRLTPATVEKHLRLARKALAARTTAQAVLRAASGGLILSRTDCHVTPSQQDADMPLTPGGQDAGIVRATPGNGIGRFGSA